MLKDITIGQYFPGHSVLHRLDPRIKMVLTIAYIVLLFLVKNSVGFLVSIVFLGVCYAVAKIPVKLILRSLKPIVPILIFTGALNLLFVSGEHPIFDWGVFHLSQEGIYTAITMAIRVLCLIAGSSLLTYTTSPIALTDAIERLLGPLKVLHFPVHELAMMMSIALRFIPTLAEETDRIRKAQAARGADFDTGSIFKRAASLIPLLVPLFVSAFRRADELATAMEARCYHGGEGRTKLNVLHMHGRDYLALMIMIAAYLLATVGGF